MVEVSGSGAVRRTIYFRNIQHYTARIDRTARKVLISRDFVRAVLSIVYRPPGTIIDRSRTHHPHIDHTEIYGLAAVLCPF
jgi:hypothetical protein